MLKFIIFNRKRITRNKKPQLLLTTQQQLNFKLLSTLFCRCTFCGKQLTVNIHF